MRLSIACLLALALAGCDKQKATAPQGEPRHAPSPAARFTVPATAGEAPAVPFTAPGGGPATLASFRGRPLLVNLWATWCAPCVAEMPTLDRLAARDAGKLQVVVVSQDGEGMKTVGPFFAKARLTVLKPYLDPQNVLMMAMKADTLPTTVLYDAKGKELWRNIGSTDWSGADVQAKIDAAVSRAAAR